MPKVTIKPGTAKGKRFKVEFNDSQTGRSKTYQFGQKGSSIRPGTEKAKNFIKRHRMGQGGMTVKKQLNEKTWKGAKVGDQVMINIKKRLQK